MDILLTAILGALGNLSNTVVKDAYEALKSRMIDKFGDNNDLKKALEDLEHKPESPDLRQILKEEISATQAERDNELRDLAKALQDGLQALPDGHGESIRQKIGGHHNIVTAKGDINIDQGDNKP